MTSRVEIGVYGVLAGVVAAVVIMAAGLPIWYVVAVLTGSAFLVMLLAVTQPKQSRRSGRRRRRSRPRPTDPDQ